MLRANTSQGKTNSPWRSRLRSCQHRLGLLDRSCSVEACFGYPGHDSLHLIESSKGIGCHIPHALIGRLAGLVSFVHAFSQSLGKCEFVARPAPPPTGHKKGQLQVKLAHCPFPGHTTQVIWRLNILNPCHIISTSRRCLSALCSWLQLPVFAGAFLTFEVLALWQTFHRCVQGAGVQGETCWLVYMLSEFCIQSIKFGVPLLFHFAGTVTVLPRFCFMVIK